MNRSIEATIYIVILALFGITFIGQVPQSKFYFYYTICLWISFGLLLTISRYFIAAKIINGEYKRAVIYMIFLLLISFFACGYLYSKYISDIANLSNVSIFEPLIIKETLPYLLIASIIGLLNTLRLTKAAILKTFYSLIVVFIIVVTIFILKYYNDIKYKGDESVKFIEENHQTLTSVLQSQQFAGKVIYIDLWFTSCGPCLEEFKAIPMLKESLKSENVEYLYLARKTSHPNDIQRWKNTIRKYNLSGWHIYMSAALAEDVWRLIEENTDTNSRSYPHYLIVNRKNTIISYDAHKPSDKELLVNMIKELGVGN